MDYRLSLLRISVMKLGISAYTNSRTKPFQVYLVVFAKVYAFGNFKSL